MMQVPIAIYNALREKDAESVRRLVNHSAATATEVLKLQASTNGSPEMVRLLLELGASTGPINLHQRTALHEAAKVGRADICRVLVEFGADPGFVAPLRPRVLTPVGENFRWTPFHLAVKNGHLEVVRYFVLECGQDLGQRVVSQVHGRSETMIQLAYKHPEMKELLRALKTEVAIASSVDSHLVASVGAQCERRAMAPL